MPSIDKGRDRAIKSRYFGLTGLPASGKGTFKDLLLAELDRRGIGHAYHSLSDELRAEVRFRGLPVDRDVLRSMGHELRLKHGSGVLSERVVERIARDARQGRQVPVTVVDAIRNPAEVRVLRESLGDDFVLVAIEAPVEAIIQRIRARAREGDVVQDDELARQVLAAEMGVDEPEHGHNIAECIAMADVHIDNGGPLSTLEAAVQRLVEEQVAPAL
ncbi:MAG TPA: AAA family ATPase [Chloroflexota bacterium]|nr:AAA family ATPase [Chloroflexota bacterium]